MSESEEPARVSGYDMGMGLLTFGHLHDSIREVVAHILVGRERVGIGDRTGVERCIARRQFGPRVGCIALSGISPRGWFGHRAEMFS